MSVPKDLLPKRFGYQFTTLLAFTFILAACHTTTATTTTTANPAAVDQGAKNTPRAISALGRIEPETKIRKVAVPGAVEGDRIEEIFVKENQHVKKGQPLARLNSYASLKAGADEAKEQVAVALSRLDQVKAGAKKSEIRAQEYKIESLRHQLAADTKTQNEIVSRCQLQLAESKRQYDRNKQLYDQGAISAGELDRWLINTQTMDKNLAEAIETRTGKLTTQKTQIEESVQTRDKIAEVRPVDVRVAETEVSKAKAAYNRAQTELGFATVRAPQDGQILKIVARPGDKVTGDGILEMADTSKMIVVAEVYQTDAPKLYLGQKATITADGFEQSLQGTVYEFGSQITKQTIFSGKAGDNQDLRIVEVKLRLAPKDIQSDVNCASNLQVNVLFDIRPEASH